MSENDKLKVNSQGKPLVDPMVFEKDSPYYEKPEKELKQPMVFDVPTKSVEDKLFLVLIFMESQDELFDGSYKVCKGRTETFRYIEKLIQAFGDDVDVHNSKVMTETKQTETDSGDSKYYMINYEDCISVYAFCKGVEGNYEGFNIDDFFSAPTDDSIRQPVDLNNISQRIYAATDDPIIAQAAIETYKEMHNLDVKPVKPSAEVAEPQKPFNAKEEFPGLFEDNGDGSVNV